MTNLPKDALDLIAKAERGHEVKRKRLLAEPGVQVLQKDMFAGMSDEAPPGVMFFPTRVVGPRLLTED